uniref:Hva1_TUDOR domain-containing protein n=1 Tax=Panagrellus redivivus TaxID=6233 RepID=A0A7E4UQT3_PANRE
MSAKTDKPRKVSSTPGLRRTSDYEVSSRPGLRVELTETDSKVKSSHRDRHGVAWTDGKGTNGFTEPPIITINPDASHSKTRMNSIVEEAHHNGSDDSFIHLQDASHPDGVDIDLLNSDRESDTNSAKSVAGSRESLLHSE